MRGRREVMTEKVGFLSVGKGSKDLFISLLPRFCNISDSEGKGVKGVRYLFFRTEINADGEDVAILKVEVLDKEGRPVPTANNKIAFNVSGTGGAGGARIVSVVPQKRTCADRVASVTVCRSVRSF
jgi:hypothetical protein